MDSRYFLNQYKDYTGGPVEINKQFYRELIKAYVREIIDNTTADDSRSDLYVGDAG